MSVTLQPLLNLDKTRTTLFTEQTIVASDGSFKLTYIPLRSNTTTITDTTTGTLLAVASFTLGAVPTANQVLFDWKDDYDYITALPGGTVAAARSGHTISAVYIPAASPVSADPINTLIGFYNTYKDIIVTPALLSTVGVLSMPYANLTGAPGLASTSTSGLLSSADKTKLDNVSGSLYPIGSLLVGGGSNAIELAPSTWGGPVSIVSSSSISASIVGGSVKFDINTANIGIPSTAQLAFLTSVSNAAGGDYTKVIGSTGAQGPMGPRGYMGDPGATGLTGPIGPTGFTGAAGDRGLPGPQGATGVAGADGAVGPQGEQGVQGISAITTLAGLADVSVSVTPTDGTVLGYSLAASQWVAVDPGSFLMFNRVFA